MHPENIPTLGLDFNLLDFPEGPVYGFIFSGTLDEITSELDKNDFYDSVHTTIIGSKKIAKMIYPKLFELLTKQFFFK